jgi:hypothetical protein
MKLSLIVRGQHPPGDTVQHLRDDLDLVRCADSLGFDGIVKGSHFSAHPFESVQQIPFLSYCAAIAPRLRIICGLVLVPLHKPLDLAEQLATLDLRAAASWSSAPESATAMSSSKLLACRVAGLAHALRHALPLSADYGLRTSSR